MPGHDLRVLLESPARAVGGDRRRVIVRLNQEAHDAKILPLYAAKAPGAASVLAGFSDEQLATVAAFLRALADETDETDENGATG